jgi:hypothetical protein
VILRLGPDSSTKAKMRKSEHLKKIFGSQLIRCELTRESDEVHHGSKDSGTEEKKARCWSCLGSQMRVGVKVQESSWVLRCDCDGNEHAAIF